MHTNYTDGHSSIEDYFIEAQRKGLKFIALTEHVRRTLTYDYAEFREEVYRCGKKFDIAFAVGAEAKVLNVDGELDISEEVLSLIHI